jgi:hypothetical protein
MLSFLLPFSLLFLRAYWKFSGMYVFLSQHPFVIMKVSSLAPVVASLKILF